jgi:hypothetical protein
MDEGFNTFVKFIIISDFNNGEYKANRLIYTKEAQRLYLETIMRL